MNDDTVTSTSDLSEAITGAGESDVPVRAAQSAHLLAQAFAEVKSVIVGQEHMVERLMVALLARGHCLLEGVPGVAKTLAVRTFARVVGGEFARLQFTPDLVPSDIVGTRIYRPSKEAFDVELGPVFVNFVLADEINRAPAKVQSAMLELMAERQVSIGGSTYAMPSPFIVIATQNPIESEGVYPLPEAQRDRFLMQVDVSLPEAAEEFQILNRMSVRPPEPQPVLDPAQVNALQQASDGVFVHRLVADYVVRLVLATRRPAEYHLPDLEPVIDIGASPRATLGLVASARALALMRGRDYVLPQDVVDVGRDVLPHRLMLAFDAIADGVGQQQVVDSILQNVPQPRPIWRHGGPDGSGPAGPGVPGFEGSGGVGRSPTGTDPDAKAGPQPENPQSGGHTGAAGPSGPRTAPPGAPEFT